MGFLLCMCTKSISNVKGWMKKMFYPIVQKQAEGREDTETQNIHQQILHTPLTLLTHVTTTNTTTTIT